MSSTKACQHCGCSEIDTDPARGDAVCTNCGSVLEDSIIVSEIQFEENAHGGSRAIGQLISADGTSGRSLGGFQHGSGKESRALTLQKARRKIVQVAERLRLNQHCIDTAFNFYKMALTRHLTRGRRHSHVVAACIYMVCRIEGTPHMLLDLSDVVQVNVYELGKTFLKLSSALCINIPAIDPCLYIVRFAHHLEFADKTHEVSMTALRLVQRMKRDWMHTGRRPSGLCGAALLVASRLHDFSRTIKDLVRVVKVCETTIRKRLTEFGDTPSSRLTLEEFMTIDLEEEQDPPCFKAARRKQKGALDDPGKVDRATQEVSELQKKIEGELEDRRRKVRGRFARFAKEDTLTQEEEMEISHGFIIENTMATINDCLDDTQSSRGSDNGATSAAPPPLRVTSEPRDNDEDASSDDAATEAEAPLTERNRNLVTSLRPTAATLGLKESIEECMRVRDCIEDTEETGELDLDGLDDDELDSYIMTDAEVKLKTRFWTMHHAEYLKEQEEKEARRAQEMEENANKPEPKKRKRRKRTNVQANTAGEAIEKMLQEKKISNKINYDVLKSLNSTDVGFPLEPQPPQGSSEVDLVETASVVSETTKKKRKEKPPPKLTSLMSTMKSIAMSQPKEVRLDSDDEQDEPAAKVVKEVPSKDLAAMQELEDEMLEHEDEDLDEDYEEKEQHLSVAQLLGQHRGEEQDEYYMEEADDYID
ncbi:transcription factor IIIB 90 kDa subunit isoform X1 [Ixodes scapularis]|uniref:transcription factor IIIB 90 kDa subunit isoform X1 n=1 Tax=Ixodes scapularis TaxID=6945 RepID=UPI001A9E4110|nr:transcription factor IIIB 90 kDa subunit isoform X1 [Ixodes scapularis]XP_029830039.4 transcription factor IIIB 90 kDa subunit isoform X1 [Ixodes scapularis]